MAIATSNRSSVVLNLVVVISLVPLLMVCCSPVMATPPIKAIAAGEYHSLALKDDGTVVAWGNNSHGQCNMPTPPKFVSTGTAQPYYVSVSDGTIVRDYGSVKFAIDWGTPPLAGTSWVQVTRKAAINKNGELWMLAKDGNRWEQYPSPHRYITLSETETWTAAIAIDEQGKTILEIPGGNDQPSAKSDIAKDVAALNAGINPHSKNKDKPIDPHVPGWKSFIAVKDFGVALSTDGRVFGVGKNNDHQFNLPGRYSKIAAAGHKDKRYSLGIRTDDGSIDFAGTDPSTIREDIKAANLTHVISIAAGNDRAIAITRHGGIKVLGKQTDWADSAPPQSLDGPYSSITVSKLPSGQYVFLAGQEPGQHVHLTGKLVPGQPIPLAADSRVSRDEATLHPGSVITHYANGLARIDPTHGNTLWIDDAETDHYLLPGRNTAVPSTYVIETQESSIVIDESTPGTTSITDATNTETLVTIHDTDTGSSSDTNREHRNTLNQGPNVRGTTPILQYTTPTWVVWAANHYQNTQTDFGSYEAEWTVPDKPQEDLFNPTDRSNHVQSCFFSSVESYPRDNYNSRGIFQPILAYNWAQNPHDANQGWSAWIYDYMESGMYGYAISPQRITDIHTGDKIKATITCAGTKWTASLTRTKTSDGSTETATLICNHAWLDPKNVDTEVVYEAYLKALAAGTPTTHNQKYFLGNTYFHNIVMRDRNGHVIPTAFNAYANNEWWNYKTTECPDIGVEITTGANNFCSIYLKTRSP